MYLKLAFLFAGITAAWSPSVKNLGQLEKGTAFDSLVLRPNGDILVPELSTSPNIWMIERSKSGHFGPMKLLATLPEGNSAISITQVKHHHHKKHNGIESYVITGGTLKDFIFVPQTFSAYLLEFGNDDINTSYAHNSPPISHLSKIASLGPLSTGPNGITSSSEMPDLVFITECYDGWVGVLNVTSQHYTPKVFVYPEMKPPKADIPSHQLPGINGIKIHDNHLYFTNSVLVSLFKIAINAEGYPEPGAKPQLVANMTEVASIVDDFTLDPSGNIAWVATNLDNTLLRVDLVTGKNEIYVGGVRDPIVEGISSVAVGKDGNLYGVTSGGIEKPIDGEFFQGAEVVKIQGRRG